MSTPDDELPSTETGPLADCAEGTKRRHDDLGEAGETDMDRVRKRQCVGDDIFEDIWDFENLNDPASFFSFPDPNINDPNGDQFAVGSDGIEIPCTLGLQLHNYPDPNDANPVTNSIYDAANNVVLAPEPAIEFPIQAESTIIGELEEGGWLPPTFDGVFHDSIWDYLVDPMLEAQPQESDPSNIDGNGISHLNGCGPVPPQDTAETPDGAELPTQPIGGTEALGEQPPTKPIAGIETLNELELSPYLGFSSYLASYRNGSDDQKTKSATLTFPEGPPLDVQENQNPLSGQMPSQYMFYDALFEPEPWYMEAHGNNFVADDLQGNESEDNYPLQFLEPSTGHDGDETQVKDMESSFSRPVPPPEPTNVDNTEDSAPVENHDTVTQGNPETPEFDPGLSARLRLDLIATHLGRPLPAPTTPALVTSQVLPDSVALLGTRVPPIPARPTRVRARAGQPLLKATVVETAAPSNLQATPTLLPVASEAAVPAPIPAPVSDATPHPLPAPAPVAAPPPPSSRLSRPSPPTVPAQSQKPTASCTRCHNKNNPQPCLPGKMTCVGCSSRRKSLRQQREEEGLCTTCGKQRDNDGKLTCGECRAKGRVRYAKGKGKERG